jgi:hypothetical protein
MAGSRIEKITEKVKELLEEADAIRRMYRSRLQPGGLPNAYNNWYVRATRLVQANLPEQQETFLFLYNETHDYIVRGRTSYLDTFYLAFEGQIGIVAAIPGAIALRALDLRGLVSADLLDSELDAAQVLLDNGFIRAAGAVAGVVAEGHLKLLHDQASLAYDKNDGIYKLAERLKSQGLISQADERRFQAVADVRNNCDHKKPLDPTDDEVRQMIKDVNELIKRVQIP